MLVDDTIYLAYRVRRPIGEGRGYRNVVARSADGVRFEHGRRGDQGPVRRRVAGAAGAGADTPEGRWRLYVSCATPGTKHWWVDVLEADTPEGLATAPRRTVLPGGDTARA